MSPNISGSIVKHFREYPRTFWGIFSNIPENVSKHSEKCSQTFRRMSPNIPGNVAKKLRGKSLKIPRNSTKGWLSNSTVGHLSMGPCFIKLLLFAVDFTSAKKNTKKIVKCLVVKCYYTFCQANHYYLNFIFTNESKVFLI